MAHKFEIYRDKKKEFRVRFKHNSEVMFSTEGYASKASAKNAIKQKTDQRLKLKTIARFAGIAAG